MKKLFLVYNADKGVVGHLRYVFEKLAKDQGCSLCDITHRGAIEKRGWEKCKQSASLPVEVIYRNELSAPMIKVANGEYPCGLLKQDDQITKVLGADSIGNCSGSVRCLNTLISEIPLDG